MTFTMSTVAQARQEIESFVLSREALTDPQRLVDELTAIATAYGLSPDGAESSRPALVHIARMLQHVLFPLTTKGGG